MYLVNIEEELCTGCDSCAAGCPASILAFNSDVQKAFVSGDESECMGCEACTAVCESGAITVTEI